MRTVRRQSLVESVAMALVRRDVQDVTHPTPTGQHLTDMTERQWASYGNGPMRDAYLAEAVELIAELGRRGYYIANQPAA